jgi:hypothetical protein
LKVAFSAPTMLGVTNMVIVQFWPAAIELPHEELQVKSGLSAPLRANPVTETAVLPALVRVTALLTCVPFLTVPKFNEDGVNRMAVRVPDKATVWGVVTSLSPRLKLPET